MPGTEGRTNVTPEQIFGLLRRVAALEGQTADLARQKNAGNGSGTSAANPSGSVLISGGATGPARPKGDKGDTGATGATGSAGPVSSVSLAAPAFLSVSGSPVTTSGTLTLTLATQTANLGFFGPTTGAAAAPTFRAMVTADIPDGIVTISKLSATGTPSNTTFLRGDGVWGVPAGGSATGTLESLVVKNLIANGSFLVTDNVVLVTGIAFTALTVGCPSPAAVGGGNGWSVLLKRLDNVAGTVVLTPAGAFTFDNNGTSSSTFTVAGNKSYLLFADGVSVIHVQALP